MPSEIPDPKKLRDFYEKHEETLKGIGLTKEHLDNAGSAITKLGEQIIDIKDNLTQNEMGTLMAIAARLSNKDANDLDPEACTMIGSVDPEYPNSYREEGEDWSADDRYQNVVSSVFLMPESHKARALMLANYFGVMSIFPPVNHITLILDSRTRKGDSDEIRQKIKDNGLDNENLTDEQMRMIYEIMSTVEPTEAFMVFNFNRPTVISNFEMTKVVSVEYSRNFDTGKCETEELTIVFDKTNPLIETSNFEGAMQDTIEDVLSSAGDLARTELTEEGRPLSDGFNPFVVAMASMIRSGGEIAVTSPYFETMAPLHLVIQEALGMESFKKFTNQLKDSLIEEMEMFPDEVNEIFNDCRNMWIEYTEPSEPINVPSWRK